MSRRVPSVRGVSATSAQVGVVHMQSEGAGHAAA